MDADTFYYFLSITFSKCIIKDNDTGYNEDIDDDDILKLVNIKTNFKKNIDITYDYEDLNIMDMVINDVNVNDNILLLCNIIGVDQSQWGNELCMLMVTDYYIMYLDKRISSVLIQVNIFFIDSTNNPVSKNSIKEFWKANGVVIIGKIRFDYDNENYDCIYIRPSSVNIADDKKVITPLDLIVLDTENTVINDVYITRGSGFLTKKLEEYNNNFNNIYNLPYLTKTILFWFKTYAYSYFESDDEKTMLNQIVNNNINSYDMLKKFYMTYITNHVYNNSKNNGYIIHGLHAANNIKNTTIEIRNVLSYRPDNVIQQLNKSIQFLHMISNVELIYRNIKGLDDLIEKSFKNINLQLEMAIEQDSLVLEEKINNSIITYLKINNVNPQQMYNFMRYKIHYSNSKKNLIVNYNDDFDKNYEQTDQTLDKGNLIFKNNTYPNYLIGKFTKIFLSTETNTDIAKKMEHILNKTNPADPNASPLPIFIVGYGSSGAGKTSNLIYFRKKNGPGEEGILPNLCKQIISINSEKNIVFKNLILRVKEYSVHSEDEKYIKYEFNDKLNLIDNTEVVIKHSYRFNYDFTNLESDYNIISKNRKYEFKKGTSLGEIIIFLVDVDRLVKATTNNPQSSRSHVLVFVDIFFEPKNNVNKDVNLIVGDFAGIENKFNCDLTETIATLSKQVNTLLVDKKGHDGDNVSYYENEPIWDGNLKYWDNDETLGEEKLDDAEQTFMNTVFKKNNIEKLYRLKYGIDYLENNKNDSYLFLYNELNLTTTSVSIKDVFQKMLPKISTLMQNNNNTFKRILETKVTNGLQMVKENFKDFKDTSDGKILLVSIEKKKKEIETETNKNRNIEDIINGEINAYVNANKPDEKECDNLQTELESTKNALDVYNTNLKKYEINKLKYENEITTLKESINELKIKNADVNKNDIINEIRKEYITKCNDFLKFENHSIQNILTPIFKENNNKIKTEINNFIKNNNIELEAPKTTGEKLGDESKIFMATYKGEIKTNFDYKLLNLKESDTNLVEYKKLISKYYAIPRFFNIDAYKTASTTYIATERRIKTKEKNMEKNILYLMFCSSKFNKCFDANPTNTEFLIKQAVMHFLDSRGVDLQLQLPTNVADNISKAIIQPPSGSGGIAEESKTNNITIENDLFKINLDIFIGVDFGTKLKMTKNKDDMIKYINDNVYTQNPANDNYLGTNITFRVKTVTVKALTDEKYNIFFNNKFIKEIEDKDKQLLDANLKLSNNIQPELVTKPLSYIENKLITCKDELIKKKKVYDIGLAEIQNSKQIKIDPKKIQTLTIELNRLQTTYNTQNNEAITKKESFNIDNEKESFFKAIEDKIKIIYDYNSNNNKIPVFFNLEYGGYSSITIPTKRIKPMEAVLYRETLLYGEDYTKLIYYLAAKLIIHKAIKEACIHRMEEGKWINDQLQELRYAIATIVKSKDLNVFYNYNDDCIKSADYNPKQLSITNDEDIKKVMTQNTFIKDIISHILQSQSSNQLGSTSSKKKSITEIDIFKKMIICIYCVFNYGYKEIEEKPVFQYPYLNIDDLKKISFDEYDIIDYMNLKKILENILKKVKTSTQLSKSEILNQYNNFRNMENSEDLLTLPNYLETLIKYLFFTTTTTTTTTKNKSTNIFIELYKKSPIEQNIDFLNAYSNIYNENSPSESDLNLLHNEDILTKNVNLFNEVIKSLWKEKGYTDRLNQIKNRIKILIDILIKHIDVCNSTTPMGSLEFLDSIAKLNTTNYFCKIDNIPKKYDSINN